MSEDAQEPTLPTVGEVKAALNEKPAANTTDMLHDLEAAMREPLCDELAVCLTTGAGSGVPLLAHPLVHMIFPVPGHANVLLRVRSRIRDEAMEAENWPLWVGIHEKPYRMDALYQLVSEGHLTDAVTITELFIDVWTIIENVWQSHEEIEYLLDYIDRDVAMQDEFMAALPETFTVYRGHHCVNLTGMSWTTSREKAEWFAKRYMNEGGVVERTVTKDEVVFATDDRGEKEVVLRLDTHHSVE
jgi:hypothetical protein